jgi:hypothetical protein
MLRFPLRRIKAKEKLIRETKRVFGGALEDSLIK